MERTWIVTAALLVAIVLPSVVFAHAGHPHRFRGTVSVVQDEAIEVKLTDGTFVSFRLDEKTIYRQGKTKVVGKLPQVGQRVVVSAMEVEEGQTMIAETVQLPVPATASR